MNSRNGLCTKLGWIVIALCAAMAVSGPVLAHTDPAGSNSTGITITMTAFLADGTTPALGQDLTECEKIFFSARMTWAQSPSASFEGGTWTITTPDGVDHDVTPVGGIPCIGDSINSVNDPNLPGGRGLCAGTAGTILSEQVPYTVRVVDIGATPKPIFPGNPDTITAGTQLSGAFAHIGVNDLGGVTASTPISLPVARCVDDRFCSAVICDEAVQHGTFNERLGACVFVDEGTTVCPDNLFCADVACDEVNDVCAETDTSDAVCPDNLFCADVACDEVNDTCAETDTSDAVCPDNLFCADVACDEANDTCSETDISTQQCPDDLFCADVACDEVNDTCAETDIGLAQCPADTFVCSEAECDEASDSCVPGADTSDRCGMSDACVVRGCDEAVGCFENDQSADCGTSDACVDRGCDPVDGCIEEDHSAECGDSETCVLRGCDEVTGCFEEEPDPLPVECMPQGCRITAGGVTPDGDLDNGEYANIGKATFGGQVGAPCGCIGCFDELDHVQGSWTHQRKKRSGSFHARDYNSLVCGCDGVMDGELCNPGDRDLGPEPRPAPANLACWSGIGDFNPTNGRRTIRVAFRVEVEDRSEPGAGRNAPDDVYRIEIWIPDGDETAAGLADQACCTNPEPIGRAADISDGGDLIHGNIQIHPVLPHTEDGVCPVPDGSCQQ